MRPAQAAPRLVDLADELGVSTSTVSRAFTAPSLLRPDTVQRVLAAAERRGYVPNRHARALITGRTGAIGLVLPDITNPFFPPMIRTAQRLAAAADVNVFVAETGNDPDAERRVIASLLPQSEGLIIASSRLVAAELIMTAERARIVLINNDTPGIARVLLSSTAALQQAVTTMIDTGAERLAYVGGPHRSWSEAERRRAVTETAAERRIPLSVLATRTGTYAEGRAITTAILDTGATAVVAFDDVIAHGVLDGLLDAGIAVPDRIRLIGCDDTLPIQTHPRLSTIALPVAAGVTAAVGLLLDHRGTAIPEERLELTGVLELRETT